MSYFKLIKIANKAINAHEEYDAKRRSLLADPKNASFRFPVDDVKTPLTFYMAKNNAEYCYLLRYIDEFDNVNSEMTQGKFDLIKAWAKVGLCIMESRNLKRSFKTVLFVCEKRGYDSSHAKAWGMILCMYRCLLDLGIYQASVDRNFSVLYNSVRVDKEKVNNILNIIGAHAYSNRNMSLVLWVMKNYSDKLDMIVRALLLNYLSGVIETTSDVKLGMFIVDIIKPDHYTRFDFTRLIEFLFRYAMVYPEVAKFLLESHRTHLSEEDVTIAVQILSRHAEESNDLPLVSHIIEKYETYLSELGCIGLKEFIFKKAMKPALMCMKRLESTSHADVSFIFAQFPNMRDAFGLPPSSMNIEQTPQPPLLSLDSLPTIINSI